MTNGLQDSVRKSGRGKTITGHTEAAASVMPGLVAGSPLLCLPLLNAVLFTHN